jgi:hypothetical protein
MLHSIALETTKPLTQKLAPLCPSSPSRANDNRFSRDKPELEAVMPLTAFAPRQETRGKPELDAVVLPERNYNMLTECRYFF